MRLADFIFANAEPILAEWDAFARSIWPNSVRDPSELRDHAAAILLAIARDMKMPQSELQRSDKSKGHGVKARASSKHPIGTQSTVNRPVST